MQDRDLIEKIKSGDIQAFKQLFEKYQNNIFNLCWKFVGNKQEAEDLSQDVFFKVYKSIHSFQHNAQFSTWIYRISVNLCLNYIRDKKRFSWLSFDQPHQQDNSELIQKLKIHDSDLPDSSLERKEREAIIWKAINSLPGSQKSALILQRYEGLSCQEISEILNSSLPSVQALLYRAKKGLYKKLLPYLKKI